MAHVGVFCLPMSSHVNLFLTLARALVKQGDRVTFFGIPDNEAKVRDSGFGFEPLEPDGVPPGTLGAMMRQMGDLGNVASMMLQGRFDELRYRAILSKGPDLVTRSGIDGLIIDQAEACTGSVAEFTRLPWVSVCSGLCLNQEPGVPPFLTSWRYSLAPWAVARNRFAYACLKVATLQTQSLINSYRKAWHLQPLTCFNDAFSPLAQICQQNREFDFPRKEIPDTFHYVGPIHRPPQISVDFPWDRIRGRRFIYASLGTVVNRHRWLYRLIAEACAGLDAQLVISLGGGDEAHNYSDLPGSPIVVKFAPQVELLKKAALTITHAGLNTTLESLSHGVPLVAIPITFEQPAIAARIRWTRTGEFVSFRRVTAARLRPVVDRVLNDPVYRQSAERMKKALSATDGCTTAVNIVRHVIRTGRPFAATELTRSAASRV